MGTAEAAKIFISIHALREEGDPSRPARCTRTTYFYPRPPRGGRHADELGELITNRISIHALREEGDLPFCPASSRREQFLSTPSARRATLSSPPTAPASRNFYPRPPRGGRRDAPAPRPWLPMNFYPRPPRGGRPAGDKEKGATTYFYPRPPRGGRLEAYIKPLGLRLFLSTPSARRATHGLHGSDGRYAISIHALREEGDAAQRSCLKSLLNISIHALREEGDCGRS